MNPYGKVDDAERWEEYREPHIPIRYVRLLGPRAPPYSNVRSPVFGGPLSHHDRQASGVPSLVASDASSGAEDPRDLWRGDISDCSSSSDLKLHSMSAPPPRPSQSSIEISPGVQVRLRGADETWEAIEHDYYMPTECICCESTIFCIQDADYVLCPGCRVVSRLEGSSSRGMGGVGLGFKYADLARWQDDILRAKQEKTQRQI
jgi:hypothetical protein